MVFISVIALAALLFRLVPIGFVPSEDQGIVISSIMLPDGASLQRTAATGDHFRQMAASKPEVEHVFLISGYDIIGGAAKPNGGTMFTKFKDWDERDAGVGELVP